MQGEQQVVLFAVVCVMPCRKFVVLGRSSTYHPVPTMCCPTESISLCSRGRLKRTRSSEIPKDARTGVICMQIKRMPSDGLINVVT